MGKEKGSCMIAENNERKRNILWRTAISVSSIVIILIAVYFIVRMFTANPMEGSWVDEDSGRMIEIQGNEIAKVEWQDEADGSLQGCQYGIYAGSGFQDLFTSCR